MVARAPPPSRAACARAAAAAFSEGSERDRAADLEKKISVVGDRIYIPIRNSLERKNSSFPLEFITYTN
jgi:hypothetical protein